jgi:hypothetical protein
MNFEPVPMDIDIEIPLAPKPYRKQTIPKTLKIKVWDFYIGEKNGIGICLCCNEEKIKAAHFECGHVISEYNGGPTCLENLRPICSRCNRSIGSKNMDKFMDIYSFTKPKNWNGYEKIKREVIVIE